MTRARARTAPKRGRQRWRLSHHPPSCRALLRILKAAFFGELRPLVEVAAEEFLERRRVFADRLKPEDLAIEKAATRRLIKITA
jgi:hypothetical protein